MHTRSLVLLLFIPLVAVSAAPPQRKDPKERTQTPPQRTDPKERTQAHDEEDEVDNTSDVYIALGCGVLVCVFGVWLVFKEKGSDDTIHTDVLQPLVNAAQGSQAWTTKLAVDPHNIDSFPFTKPELNDSDDKKKDLDMEKRYYQQGYRYVVWVVQIMQVLQQDIVTIGKSTRLVGIFNKVALAKDVEDRIKDPTLSPYREYREVLDQYVGAPYDQYASNVQFLQAKMDRELSQDDQQKLIAAFYGNERVPKKDLDKIVSTASFDMNQGFDGLGALLKIHTHIMDLFRNDPRVRTSTEKSLKALLKSPDTLRTMKQQLDSLYDHDRLVVDYEKARMTGHTDPYTPEGLRDLEKLHNTLETAWNILGTWQYSLEQYNKNANDAKMNGIPTFLDLNQAKKSFRYALSRARSERMFLGTKQLLKQSS